MRMSCWVMRRRRKCKIVVVLESEEDSGMLGVSETVISGLQAGRMIASVHVLCDVSHSTERGA